MDTPLITVEWDNTPGHEEELRVSVNEFKGREYFAVRIWFKGRDGNTFFPGKQGVNIPIDKAHDFMDAIIKGMARLKELQGAKEKKGKKKQQPVSDARD